MVERALARDLRRLGSEWTLDRETAAVQIGRGAFFPDFTLRRAGAQVFVEVVGFYTPEYLESKLRTLRQAQLKNFVVCIDESLACSDHEIVASEVLRFRKRIDARTLLAAAGRVMGDSPKPSGPQP
jgi:predicted nuclease of restriction endonuclease-like RecB superfamily